MKKLFIAVICVCGLILSSCKKYLDEKPDIKLTVPTSLADFQALLDDNVLTDNVTPGVLDLGTDDYYLEFAAFNALPNPVARNCYVWESDIYQGASTTDWDTPYRLIYIANVVLEGLDKFQVNDPLQQDQWNSIYGHALFVRAFSHYYLEETYGQPYKLATADTALGIPLKLTSNLANISPRETVKNVFAQIVADLDRATALLPNQAVGKGRPSKATAFALLARVSLTMHDYAKAGAAANSSLAINNVLLDFNTLTAQQLGSTGSPFPAPPNDSNFETLYYATQINYNVIRQSTTFIDTNLYNSYHIDDIRRTAFFRPNNNTPVSARRYYLKTNYTGSSLRHFSGLAVNEMYLTRAECYARAGNKDAALTDLNALLRKRWRPSIPNVTAADAEEALGIILRERRKEMIFKSVRWMDLRRLNQDPRFAVEIKRRLNGQDYTLPPNDPKYAYPIPANEILLNPMPQNPR